jgi:ABC-2 type transport system permease protein
VFNVLLANLRKVASEMRRYLPNTISTVVTFYAIFLMFFLGIQVLGAPESAETNTQYVIVSTALWFLALMAMQGIGWEITLEQLYMSPVGAWRILLARMVGTVLVNLLIIALMLFLSMATARQWLNLDLITLAPILALTIFGMLGVGFMVAGLSLIFKQVDSLLQIAQFVFLALVAVPLSALPLLELAPVVKGADMVRGVMVEGVFLTEFSSLDWLSLGVNAAAYFLLGVFLYGRAERRAMNRGLLGQY